MTHDDEPPLLPAEFLCSLSCPCRSGWRQVASTGEWWTVEALPYVGEPWLFRYRYNAAV